MQNQTGLKKTLAGGGVIIIRRRHAGMPINGRHIGQPGLKPTDMSHMAAGKLVPAVAERRGDVLLSLSTVSSRHLHAPADPAEPGEIHPYPLDAVAGIAHGKAVGDIVLVIAIGHVGPVADAGV